jgi:hypothetical protein
MRETTLYFLAVLLFSLEPIVFFMVFILLLRDYFIFIKLDKNV